MPATGQDNAPAWGRRQAGLVFAAALLPRLVHWWFVRHTPLADEYVPDLSAYLFYVGRIMDSLYFFVEPMLMSPGYPLVLAPQYILFGPDVPLFVLTNAVLDAGSAALCAGLAARLAPPGRERLAGLSAGLLYALCGGILFYALLPLGEGPAIFFLLAGLTLLFDAQRDGRAGPAGPARAWLAGALLALAALNRPNLAPALVLGLLVWGAWLGEGAAKARLAEARARRIQALRGLLAFLLVLAPFMAHNLAVSGGPSPFGFQGGLTLYVGNHPGASGVNEALPGLDNTPYYVLLQAWRQAEAASGRELTPAEADAWWYGRARAFFRERPAEAAGLLGRKALLLLNNSGQDATVSQDFCARFSRVPGALSLPVGLVFALAGAGLLLGTRSRPERAALLAVALGLAGMLVLFQVTPRYRVVLLPLLLPLAGLAVAELVSLRRESRPLSLRAHAAPLLAFGFLLGLSLLPLDPLLGRGPGARAEVLALEHARPAQFYLLKGPQDLAQAEFHTALALGAPEQERLRAGLAASQALRGLPRAAP